MEDYLKSEYDFITKMFGGILLKVNPVILVAQLHLLINRMMKHLHHTSSKDLILQQWEICEQQQWENLVHSQLGTTK